MSAIFTSRSNELELLDRDDNSFEAIKQNMRELDFINTWLGGHKITLSGVKSFLNTDRPKGSVVICEIGCGGGDNLRAIKNWCKKHSIVAEFIGIDLNKNCTTYAESRPENADIQFICSDYSKVEFAKKPDIIFSSLFTHHFSDESIVEILKWMGANSTRGFFVNDLHRHPLPYHLIKLATSRFSKSYLVKNDAPLSVLRGFSSTELNALFKKALIKNYTLQWKWAYRWLAIARS